MISNSTKRKKKFESRKLKRRSTLKPNRFKVILEKALLTPDPLKGVSIIRQAMRNKLIKATAPKDHLEFLAHTDAKDMVDVIHHLDEAKEILLRLRQEEKFKAEEKKYELDNIY